MRHLSALVLLLSVACAPAPAPPLAPAASAPAPSAPVASAPAPSASGTSLFQPLTGPTKDPFVIPENLRREQAAAPAAGELRLPKATGAAAVEPAICKAYTGAKPGPPPACGDRASALEALASAVALDGVDRDGALARLEGCAALPAPLIRALRASYAPEICAEAIVGPLLGVSPGPEAAGQSGIRGVMSGQAVASRIRRLQGGKPMPTLKGATSTEQIQTFLRDQLPPWIKLRREALAGAEALASGLPPGSYALALATSELGLVFGDFSREFRAAPLPRELKMRDDLRGVYYAGIDQLSEPVRRQATQILAEAGAMWARQGVLRERTADDVHAWLKKWNRQQVGLQGDLLLPPPPAAGASAEQRLAATLPVFASERLFTLEQVQKPELLGALISAGFPEKFRGQLDPEKLPPEVNFLAARGRSELGLRWREGVQFDEALRALKAIPPDRRSPEARFWLALALAFRQGFESLPADLAASGLPPVVPTDALESLSRASPPGPFTAHAIVTLVGTLDLFSRQRSTSALEFQKMQLARLESALPLLAGAPHRAKLEELIQDRRAIVQFNEASR